MVESCGRRSTISADAGGVDHPIPAPSVDMDVLRLVVIDDHPVFSEALVARLNAEPDIRVVATASSGQEAQAVVDRYRPDVALIDVELGSDVDGIEVAARVRRDHPDVR